MVRHFHVLLISVVLAACGCVGEPRPAPALGTQAVALNEASEELEEQIGGFVEAFQSSIEQVATELERKAATAEERRSAILFRMRLTAECRDAANQPDPKEVLLDLWALSQSALDFLSRGEGKGLFGEHQEIAVTVLRAKLDDIEALARQCIADASYAQVRSTVLAYAANRPMQIGFTRAAARDLSDEPQGQALRSLISLPLAPLTALAGVGKTPDSIRSVARSVDRFTDVAEDLPANARWQCQLLAMNISEMPQFADAVGSVHRFADSSTTLAASSTELVRVAATMPANLRSEAEGLLERFDASQPQLQTTLDQATRTVESVSAASDHIRTSAAELTVTVDHIRDASQSLERAAQAVTQTAGEILKFIPASMKDEHGQLIGRGEGEAGQAGGAGTLSAASGVTGTTSLAVASTPEAADTRDDSFSFQAVGRSAEAIGETADRLRGLLADLRGTLDDGAISRETAAIDQQLRSTGDRLTLQMCGVVDHAAKRLAQLIGLAFALLVIYGLVSRGFARSRLREPR